MKILMLDIETSPNLVTVWGLFQQNVSINQIIKPGATLCWAAKWYGSKEIMFRSVNDGDKMLSEIHALLDEADAVCHYNGKNFDIPTLNWGFVLAGLPPPAPYRQIDLLSTSRRTFRKASNKLDFVSQQLGIGQKTKHKGQELWAGCMNGDSKSWRVMERYNKQDVRLLEKLYERYLPWIKGHPNRSEDHSACPHCEASTYQARGYAVSAAGRYRRYQCTSCGTWFKDRKRVSTNQFQEA
jgi:DNA polymerase elongation subunit (family B)